LFPLVIASALDAAVGVFTTWWIALRLGPSERLFPKPKDPDDVTDLEQHHGRQASSMRSARLTTSPGCAPSAAAASQARKPARRI
jgi:hypothetical protein